MEVRLEGRARKFGDDINTDYIISSTRKKETLDEAELKRYLMETLDPDFAASVRPGDLLVAGKNFGCGSAMEVAATVILAAGIQAVLAQSFSRTFYRNAINNGLVALEFDTSTIREGDRLSIELTETMLTVGDLTTCVRSSVATRLPEPLLGILECGGLVGYLKQRGGFRTP
ncbi:MAG: alpha-IPM isomerase [Gemmatimonadetes bacterium]|nr:alpha-IPM isomerase [Gemmatimonadota bacterium]